MSTLHYFFQQSLIESATNLIAYLKKIELFSVTNRSNIVVTAIFCFLNSTTLNNIITHCVFYYVTRSPYTLLTHLFLQPRKKSNWPCINCDALLFSWSYFLKILVKTKKIQRKSNKLLAIPSKETILKNNQLEETYYL